MSISIKSPSYIGDISCNFDFNSDISLLKSALNNSLSLNCKTFLLTLLPFTNLASTSTLLNSFSLSYCFNMSSITFKSVFAFSANSADISSAFSFISLTRAKPSISAVIAAIGSITLARLFILAPTVLMALPRPIHATLALLKTLIS